MLFAKRERTIRRILVVEDEALVAFDVEHLLGDAGYEVVATVDNLEDAAACIAESQLDLVLSDISLRGEGDGFDVARIAAEKGVPVLFVTGGTPDGARALALGCLSKPYGERTLKAALDAVDAILQGKKLKKLPAGLTLYEKA